jgi:hypothetical protein
MPRLIDLRPTIAIEVFVDVMEDRSIHRNSRTLPCVGREFNTRFMPVTL